MGGIKKFRGARQVNWLFSLRTITVGVLVLLSVIMFMVLALILHAVNFSATHRMEKEAASKFSNKHNNLTAKETTFRTVVTQVDSTMQVFELLVKFPYQ